MLKTKKTEPRYLTETPVKDIVDKMLRTALHDQARELEKHLANINETSVGTITEDFIETSREDLRRDKRSLEKKR